MITFRDVVRREAAAEVLARLRTHLVAGDAEAAFFAAGELEQGVLDALRPTRDDWGEAERVLRSLVRNVGAAYRAQRAGRAAAGALAPAHAALARLARLDLPARLDVRVPEGYAHYALDPMGYAHAAARYAHEVGQRRAAAAVVVGVRSIGTSLSAVVAAALGAEHSLTVRPRGAPGARHVLATPALCDALRAWLGTHADALIVDEGPGATGETFRCVAEWLVATLGIPPQRVVLFTSHAQPPGFGDADADRFYARARRYAPPPADGRGAEVCARFALSRPTDLSGGRWRAAVDGAADAVAVPRHERLKYRARDGAGRSYLIRYAGVGRGGAEALARADRLAAVGAGPRVVGFATGFLVGEWSDGRPLSPAVRAVPVFLRALGAYLAARAPLFRTGGSVDREPVLVMLQENATEALGPAPVGLARALGRLERLPLREAAVVDARLQAREWLCTPDGGFRKVDALDHGDGVRLPGPIDPAWDVAGAAVEFDLGAAATAELVARCAHAAGDRTAEFGRAVAAYRAPYAASQHAEAALAAREDGEAADRARLRREASRYAALLRRELARAGARGG